MSDTNAHLLRALEKNVRYDGRKTDDFRQLTITHDASRNAEGSAMVKLGNTQVIVGVKLAVEKPYPDRPENGNLMVNAELLPLSSAKYEPGPPPTKAILTARVIDRCIREAEAIDTSQLCIKAGEKVWSVMIDICAINDDGNILDAAAIGTIAALKNTHYPEYDKEKNEVNYHEKTDTPLQMTKEPLPVTVYKTGHFLFVDPLPDEEEYAQGMLTIGSLANGNICALQKGGEATFTLDELKKMVSLAVDKANELRESL